MERAELIVCRDLSLGYEGQSVLSHFDLRIRSGDYLCIVGDNGSGKSTLLRGLLGLLPPLAGTIERAAELEEGAVLHTTEVDDELEPLARSFFDRSPHGAKIRLHIGSALDIAPTLGGTFDLVFIDGDKREYPAYYRMLMGDDGRPPLVHAGSVLIADNILWSGKVVQPVAHNDRHTRALLDFNRTVVGDPRVENVILPLRDGLNIIRVK